MPRAARAARALPWILIASRFAIGPLLLLDAGDGSVGPTFLPLFLFAFAGDIADGILARKLGVQTAAMRSADSFADIALYSSVAASAWRARRSLVEPCLAPILVVIALQFASWLVDLAKYGRLSSYHAWSAKAWGIAQAVAAVALFGFDQAGIWLGPAIALGALNNLECIAMTLILPRWTHDVPSLVHALRRRSSG